MRTIISPTSQGYKAQESNIHVYNVLGTWAWPLYLTGIELLFTKEGRGELRAWRRVETKVLDHRTARRSAFLKAVPGLMSLIHPFIHFFVWSTDCLVLLNIYFHLLMPSGCTLCFSLSQFAITLEHWSLWLCMVATVCSVVGMPASPVHSFLSVGLSSKLSGWFHGDNHWWESLTCYWMFLV